MVFILMVRVAAFMYGFRRKRLKAVTNMFFIWEKNAKLARKTFLNSD